MGKIIGLDLGTNSIGWAIRDMDTLDENQIVDYGVVIFEKGVGEGKSGEFSLSAERRKNRSKRRLYNAKRYRKWELLKVLIENNMCPLTIEELRLWSVGNWQEINDKKINLGRIYPINNEIFQQWLAFDPMFFGDKGISENGNKIRINPYDLRLELLENVDSSIMKNFKIGRALYHLVQRRGFKSSRKSGKSAYAENAELEMIKSQNPNFHIATLAKVQLDKGVRFRASGVIQRRYFEDEFYAICKQQGLTENLTQQLYKAIFFVRPLRSQKGLVGNCTLEKRNTRIPISHPKFEEFRALSFINNIKWRKKGNQTYESIPITLKKKIFEELFFRVLTAGKNKGKITTDSYFKFEEIINNYSQNGEYEFNYKNKPNISTCPTIAALINVFIEEWKDIFIKDGDKFGINWDGLNLEYIVKYGRKFGINRKLGVNEIWHLLFDYIQTKDKQEELEKFCKDVLEFNEEKSKEFSNIDIPQGYGSLSYSAISKILPFLQMGHIYSEAVSFANLKKVLGDKFDLEKDTAQNIIKKTILDVEKEKEKLNITNGLIQKYFSENYYNSRALGVNNHIKEMAYQETIDKLEMYFGINDWSNKTDSEKNSITNEILDLYLRFLDGKQEKSEKASSDLNKNPEIDYYKLPRLDKAIKQNLKKAFNLSDDCLNALYHPSDIEMYPISKTEVKTRIDGIEQYVRQLESPQPPSKGWKNPMAMRTLHELRHLLNYLLRVGKIEPETKVIVEMARELNDANKRWAIQTYQRYREDENKEFAKAIVGVAKEKYPNLNENDIENINKVRLWWEQIENNEEVYKEVKSLKEDVHKYRLWKEQECICMYTGETISLTDLFDGTKTHFEHTLPISDSFDNSLANLTVCKAIYNTQIKKDKIPTQLENYSIAANGFQAIEPRLKKWREKVEHLKKLIEENKVRTKKTQDPNSKKDLIQKRHLLQFDFEYWSKKLSTFTVKEIPNTWKNSQLIDTQIISKYARAYLKTVFQKVDVQKGTVVNDFKKIYQIKGDEQKDRSKHSHHAIDAAVLTLIPGSARREAILGEYFEAVEKNKKYYTKPYENFYVSHVLDIENNVIINHITRDKTLVETIKQIRKRGRKTGWVAQGNSIRGRLHKETFFGAVKALERNNNGYQVKENGEYKTIKNIKTGEDEIWIVSRKAITEIKLEKNQIKDVIVDELLKKHLQKQIDTGLALSELKDFNNKPIRHIRMRVKAGVGYLSHDKAMPIKSHTYSSVHEHKREVLTQNEENYLFLLYEGKNDKDKTIRHYRILNLFDIAQLGIKSINAIKNEPEFQTIEKSKTVLSLKAILKAGDRVIFFEENKDEISKGNLINRLYKIYKFNELGENTAYLYFHHNIEARPANTLEKGEKQFISSKFQPKLEFTVEKMNCLFEGKDFKIKPDGEVVFTN